MKVYFSEIELLGEKFDFFLLVYVIQRNGFHAAIFCRLALIKMIAVSKRTSTCQKAYIDIEDLYGETLMMVQRGDSGTNDFIRHDFEKKITQKNSD